MEETTKTVVSQHAVGESQADAGAGDQQKVLRLEGAADVNAELAEIGLSNKSGWYASIVLYGAGGIVTVAAALLKPEVVPSGVLYLGIFAVLMSLLSAVGARYLTNADWATHMRLFFGLMIFLIGALVAGPLRLAFIMLPLFVLITPTFLYGARFAIPYVTITTPIAVVVVLATPGAARFAHAVIAGGALLMVVLSFMAAEHRTRSLARANRRLAYTDPLTGIANTRRLRETLAFALGRAPEEAKFALFAIDLDNFKLVNDTFDHTTGDAVLCAVAEALEAEVGADDLVARRGGDEFSVLIMHPAGVDLERTSDRLSRAIERARLATCPSITPSGSVAYVLSKPDDSISSVLQHADDNLHESKLAFHAEHGDREEMREKLEAEAENVSEIRPRISSREAAMRSVSAAVSRAYSRQRSGKGQDRFEGMATRVVKWARGLDVVWAYVAATCFPIGFFYFVLSATGMLSPLEPWIGMVSGLALMALGGLSLHAARHDANKRWLIWVFLGAVAAVSATIANAGAAGTALIDTYVVLSLYGFYFMRPRQALLMLLLCSGLFIGFAVGAGYPYGGIRSAITVSVMLVSAAIVVKVRSVTLRFVRTNRELSEVDALTGVANLRALRLRVESVLEQRTNETAENRPMLMTVDLDRFKLVNDVYNHTTGDQVLEAVARAVSECVRIDEMVARRGGDEFFVLFTNTNPEHLENVMPRVREAIAHARQRICPDLTPTASVGYVSWEPGMDADAFLAAADGIMHDEKIETRARDYEQVA